jgi:hypothetical protein
MLLFHPIELIQMLLSVEEKLGGGTSILQLRLIRGLAELGRLKQDYSHLLASGGRKGCQRVQDWGQGSGQMVVASVLLHALGKV